MHIGEWLVLSGLVVELSGALLLSIDAIGIDRVRRSITRLTSVRTFLVSKHPTNTFLDPVRFYVAAITAMGGLVIVYLLNYPPRWLQGWPYWLYPLFAGFCAAVLSVGILGALALCERLLGFLEETAERRIAGVIGFTVLGTGIGLQFAGTLFDALQRH